MSAELQEFGQSTGGRCKGRGFFWYPPHFGRRIHPCAGSPAAEESFSYKIFSHAGRKEEKTCILRETAGASTQMTKVS